MSSLSPTPLQSDATDSLFDFLQAPGIEGMVPFVYDDSKGVPTLGVGFALVIKSSDGSWEVRPNLNSFLTTAGISLTPTQLSALDAQLNNAVNKLNYPLTHAAVKTRIILECAR